MILVTLYRLYKLVVFYGSPVVFYARLGLSKMWPEKPQQRLQMQRGQGLVEYALVLVLVAVVIIAILTLLGPQIGMVFFRVNCGIAGGSVVQYGGTEWFDCLVDPAGSNAGANRLLSFNSQTGEAVDWSVVSE